jgi:cysteine synthase
VRPSNEIIPTKKKGGYVMLNQLQMKTTGKRITKTTGPEIWKDTEGTVTHFIAAMGTTGTIIGTSSYLKESSNSDCGRSTQRWISNTRN